MFKKKCTCNVYVYSQFLSHKASGGVINSQMSQDFFICRPILIIMHALSVSTRCDIIIVLSIHCVCQMQFESYNYLLSGKHFSIIVDNLMCCSIKSTVTCCNNTQPIDS